LNGFRPDGAAHIVLKLHDNVVEEFDGVAGWKIFSFAENSAAPPDTGDDSLSLATATFVPKDEIEGNQDPRALGVALDWIELAPTRSANALGSDAYWIDWARAPIVPPIAPVASWTFVVALLYVVTRTLQLPYRALQLTFGVLILLVASGFALARIYVTIFTDTAVYLALGLTLLALVIYLIAPRAFTRLSVNVEIRDLGVLTGIALAQVALKLGGILYPQFYSSDVVFHAHRLEFVEKGLLFFTSLLPDAAARVVPYPPALYIFLSPLAQFVADYPLLIEVANVLADTVAIFVVYVLARKLFDDARVQRFCEPYGSPIGLLSAFLFAFNPVSFFVYSWGNHTNIFGQFAATLLFAVLLTQRANVYSPLRLSLFALALFFFLVASLAHLGVFLSLVLWLPLAFVWLLASRKSEKRAYAVALLILFALGVTLAWLLYYAEFSTVLGDQAQRFVNDFVAGRAATKSASAVQLFTPERIGALLRHIAEELGLVLLVVGLIGLPFVWRKLSHVSRPLFAAWLVVAVAFAAIAFASTFSARFTLWAAPALALSGGVALASLFPPRGIDGKKNRAMWLAYGACAFAFGQTMWLWLDRVLYAYH
jgi:hypothetical protein